MQLTYCDTTIELVIGNIVDENTDALVNAANSSLAGGGGVDGAIHRRGGPSIMEETNRRYPQGCSTGMAVVSGAGNLAAKYVVHTVAPRYHSGDHRCAGQLSDAYRNSLVAAAQHGCRSISFPSLGTGAYHYPLDQAAEIALQTLRDYLDSVRSTPIKLARFVLFDAATFDSFCSALFKIFPHPWTMDETDVHGATDYQSVEEVRRYDERMRLLRNVDAENASILEHLPIQPHWNVMEIGTGTGAFARAIAKQVKRVVAVDLSAAMLEYAQLKAREEQLENIQFVRNGFLTFEIPKNENRFNLVLSSLALHHLPDTWKAQAVKRIYDSLLPGGLLVLIDVVWQMPGCDFDTYFAEMLENKFHPGMILAICDHAKKEYSTFGWVMEGILTQAGFSILTKEPFSPITTLYIAKKSTTET
ncbi:MAG: macro domain-containing protein [Thermoguttaceae bacterium]|nr:macro domain-containing protein [Thermoguttaceae bacterium]